MKNYFINMVIIISIIGCIINFYKLKDQEIYMENMVVNNIVFQSDINYNYYEREIVYEGLTIKELGAKIDNYLNSTLNGYGETIATLALESEVDPVIAASIVLVETGCKWNCSRLVKECNNIGGMKGAGGCGSYAKFSTLDEGIKRFISNLSKNYFKMGLTTPETMNKKYAANPNWHNDVNYYVNLIKAS